MGGPTPVPVLWLDLDGTVREGKDDPLGRFVNGPEDVRVFPEAVERMREWKARGGHIVGITNQGGVALGFVTLEQVIAAHHETQRQCGGLFDRVMTCIHHPDAEDPLMARCWCRKPLPGLIIEAGLDLNRQCNDTELYPPHLGLFVGDLPSDRVTANVANLSFQWAADWRAGNTNVLAPEPIV